jgi:CobQ-like glutamine amidotransferase family enzyme
VCAGYQLIGRQFPDAAGHPHDGVGLLDVTTDKGTGPRAVGELSARLLDGTPSAIDGAPLPRLSGFENHGGVTTVGPGAAPLAQVLSGVGNGGGDGTEGAWKGRVVGTYLHGPVLARNIALADLLLGWAVGGAPGAAPLAPLDDTEEDALRAERLAAVGASRSSTRSPWVRRPRRVQ